MVGYVHIQFEDTILISGVQCRHHIEIFDVGFGLWEQEYITFNTAHAPEVLAFQIRTGTPAEYFDDQRVFAGFQVVVD